MTQTTHSHSQAVEAMDAALQVLEANGANFAVEAQKKLRDAIAAALTSQQEVAAPVSESAPEAVVTGVLYGFASWLTCQPETISVGSRETTYQIIDALKAFADHHKLSLDSPDVENWRQRIAASRVPVASGAEPVNDPDRWADAAMPPDVERRLALWLTNGAALHPLTINLVVRFARALAAKLAAAETKYGYSDGWLRTDWMDECRAHLMEHIGKGDPRDVAAYCAFLWHHGESTATPAPEQATTGSGQRVTDAERLDFMTANRMAVMPEYEGPWEAQTYPDDATEPVVTAHGDTPREAIDAAILSTASPAGEGEVKT